MIFTRPRASPPIDGRLGLQVPLAPWVHYLAPSLGALCSIQ
ncbi:hypothetical protein T4D_1793 [Trichinella pseudospiralis]|uniref:Uncharacterized protein n=1 Tax=Trichinella pseudospiralis TaxID=6337 RepID=A0A0V1DLF6_TRIPS|nr:hypothetical protein T4D_1793 [Trichinella pseudospiralis]